MSKHYYYAETQDEYDVYIASDKKLGNENVWVVFETNGEPILAKIKYEMDILKALGGNYVFEEVITVIDMKPVIERKQAEYQKLKFIKAMKDEMDLVKMNETFKKHSSDSPKMQELYASYIKLFGGEKQTSFLENEERSD